MSANPFQDTVSYCGPAHGGWGIIRPCALVPESHLLFVCPSACFRHGSLGAVQHGFKNQLSFLYLEPSDIVSGYDQVILEGIDELLECLDHPIRVLFVYVSCLDDFIGTDLNKVVERASERHPDVLIRPAHMNPIASSTKLPPLVTTLDAMASILPAWDAQDEGISLFGNFASIPEDTDFIGIMKEIGRPVRQLIHCRSLEEYQQMSRSFLAVLTRPYEAYAIEHLRQRCAIRRFDMFVSYDPEVIRQQYEMLGDVLQADLAERTGRWRETALEEIRMTREALGGLPVLVSDSAVLFPFQLAAALLSFGFNVTDVYAQQLAGKDRAAMEQIQEQYPRVRIHQADAPQMHVRTRERMDALAIGEEAAYFTQCTHLVPLSEDEGMLGYSAVIRLMQRMREAALVTADIRKAIEETGAIV